MKTLSLLFILLGLGLFCQAQQQIAVSKKITIKGKVLDKDRLPLSYVTINIIDTSLKSIAIGITDEKGVFMLSELPNIKLRANFTMMGFTTTSLPITVNGTNEIDLGNIMLQQDATQLKEVAIVSQSPTISYRLDKKVFQAGKDLISQSGSATDLLAGVPSVSVNPSGAVSLRGNANVLVLINGRRSGTVQGNALDQLPADQIDRVEIITNPSSRYDAAGAAGIINIILKKNKKAGFNGQLRLVGGIPNETRISPSLNYKSDKVNIFSTFGLRLSDYVGLYQTQQENYSATKTSLLNSVQNEKRHDDAKMLYLGADIQLNAHNTITAAFLKNATNDHDFTELNYNYATKNVGADSSLVRNGESREKRSYNQLEFNYTRTFAKERKKYTIDVQYDFWDSDKDWNLTTERKFPNASPLAAIRTSSIGASKDLSAQTDLILPIDSLTTLELGIKFETRTVTSDFLAQQQLNSSWQTLEQIDNKLAYEELIGGAYAQLGGKLRGLGYQLGLRSELTKIDIQDRVGSYSSEKTYTRLFPSLNLSYGIAQGATLQASYSRRINRPSLNMIYPFTELTDLSTRYIGNPDLNPSFANVMEIGYLQSWNKLTINPSLYYQQNSGVILDYTFKNAAGLFIITPVNIAKETRSGFELSVIYNAAKWVQLTSEFNIYRFRQSGTYADQDFGHVGQTFTARMGALLKFPKLISFQGRYNFNGARQQAQTKEKAIHNIDMGLSRNLFGDKATLLFDVTNLFDLRKFSTVTTGNDYALALDARPNAARYRLTFVYRLNLKENQKVRQAKSGNRN